VFTAPFLLVSFAGAAPHPLDVTPGNVPSAMLDRRSDPPRQEHRLGPAAVPAIAINPDWAGQLALTAADLSPGPDQPGRREFARAEPATLRCQLLQVAARITRGRTRVCVRIDSSGRGVSNPPPPRSPASTSRPADQLSPATPLAIHNRQPRCPSRCHRGQTCPSPEPMQTTSSLPAAARTSSVPAATRCTPPSRPLR
jgi:hypothetical protein